MVQTLIRFAKKNFFLRLTWEIKKNHFYISSFSIIVVIWEGKRKHLNISYFRIHLFPHYDFLPKPRYKYTIYIYFQFLLNHKSYLLLCIIIFSYLHVKSR